MSCDKPPLGLMSESVWKYSRAIELIRAMERYIDANYRIPQSWLQELNTLCGEEENKQ